jgi:hypothetical protein
MPQKQSISHQKATPSSKFQWSVIIDLCSHLGTSFRIIFKFVFSMSFSLDFALFSASAFGFKWHCRLGLNTIFFFSKEFQLISVFALFQQFNMFIFSLKYSCNIYVHVFFNHLLHFFIVNFWILHLLNLGFFYRFIRNVCLCLCVCLHM